MARGRYIVFEGIEGSGKSTQAKIFYKALRKNGSDAILTEEPWESDDIGRLIRKELKESGKKRLSNTTLQLLYMANRSNHVERVVEPGLADGNVVVQDRYWMSTAVYGSIFSSSKRVYRDYFTHMSEIFPKPDIVFLIDVNPKEAYKRIISRKNEKERFDKLGTLKLLSRGYGELEKAYDGRWINIDGNRGIDAIGAEIMRRYMSTFK